MKYLLHMCFAQGQHEYASFDIIVMNYLYAQNQEMTRWLDFYDRFLFSSIAKISNLECRVKALMKESKKWSQNGSMLFPVVQKTGNFIQTFSEDSRTSLRSKIDPSELKSFTKSLTAYFNFHESARLSENLTEFRSFNNNEIKSQLPTLAASKFYWQRWQTKTSFLNEEWPWIWLSLYLNHHVYTNKLNFC